MKITIKLFASIRDICGFEEKEMTLPDSSTVDELINILELEHRKLAGKRSSILIAVNEEYSTEGRILNNRDVVALFPPVSGG